MCPQMAFMAQLNGGAGGVGGVGVGGASGGIDGRGGYGGYGRGVGGGGMGMMRGPELESLFSEFVNLGFIYFILSFFFFVHVIFDILSFLFVIVYFFSVFILTAFYCISVGVKVYLSVYFRIFVLHFVYYLFILYFSLFSFFGQVVIDQKTGENKGYCFVLYDNEQSAQNAIRFAVSFFFVFTTQT
jgi:hypothetical protein